VNTGFLGIGTPELILILVIAVLVVGPEKLVELATKMGHWVAKIRSMSDGATKEFREALEIDDIEQSFKEIANEVKDVDRELRDATKEVTSLGNEAASAARDLQTIVTGKDIGTTVNQRVTQAGKELVLPSPTASPVSQKPAGKIPQAVIDAVGEPPKTRESSPSSIESGGDAVVEDDVNAKPVELQEKVVIEKEEDYTPIVIEDTELIQQEQQGQEEGSS